MWIMSVVSPVQFTLFELGPDISELRQQREELMHYRQAKNTESAYANSWKIFTSWCDKAGRSALPASEETVSLFVTARLNGHRLATVWVDLAAIRQRHLNEELPSPVSASTRALMRSAARQRREKPAGKSALTPKQLRRLSASLGESGIDIRDRCIFVVGFSAGWRASELTSLELSDISFSRGRLTLTLGASKTDQDGKEGRYVALSPGRHPLTCPVRCMRAWLKVRGDWPGPLFCLVTRYDTIIERSFLPDVINTRLKTALKRAGVNPASFGAHSLRAGMATAAAENNASELAIMKRGGWKSVNMVLRYVRPVKAFKYDAMAGVL
jgi:integrase